MKKMLAKIDWQKYGFVTIILTALLTCGITMAVSGIAVERKAQVAYPIGSRVELQTDYPPYNMWLEVKKIDANLDTFNGRIHGTLIVQQPTDALYLGLSNGSTVINWSYENGGGWSWIITDLHPMDGSSIEVVVTDVKTIP